MSSSMSMPSAMSGMTSPSMTMSMASASSTAASTMSGMDMGSMGMGGDSCKISMTWNWYTVGACFISDTWQITSKGMFAGSCIGIICLVVSLEFLRRVQREYDAFVRRQDQKQAKERTLNRLGEEQSISSSASSASPSPGEQGRLGVSDVNGKVDNHFITTRALEPRTLSHKNTKHVKVALLQRQLIRALLHMVQFGVAYFIMLLAMYYNGYVIISILIGAFIGSFIFSWDQLLNEIGQKQDPADVTGCCG